MNLIDACLDKGVKKTITLSTDKASNPINLYGATKLTSDKLFIAEILTLERLRKITGYWIWQCYGFEGSVIPFSIFSGNKKIPITDKRMTRFMITLEDGVSLVWTFQDMVGGEIFIRKSPSMNIMKIAEACSKNFARLCGN